jgi:hypothetical protein
VRSGESGYFGVSYISSMPPMWSHRLKIHLLTPESIKPMANRKMWFLKRSDESTGP